MAAPRKSCKSDVLTEVKVVTRLSAGPPTPTSLLAHQYFVDNPDMEHLLLDSTIVRAHPCEAGASKKAEAKRLKP